MKTIKGNLILKKDTTFNEDLRVEGSILGKDGAKYSLIVRGNINAWNINAWDISYYAVCFAYKNITCKSIKGRRDNCKHFVLDEKIEITGA
jgi:hypothetical protein